MSTLNVANISDGTDTVETGYVVNGSAKAWVNLNGMNVVAIRDSLNVSSVTDTAVGSYVENYSNAFSTSYAIGAYVAGSGSVRSVTGGPTSFTASSSSLVVTNDTESLADAEIVTTSTHGGLA